MKKRCLIISGGQLQPSVFYKEIAGKADYIICADGGARHAKALEIKPDLVVGDFDTLTEAELGELEEAGVKTIRYPREKDHTDTQIALLKALEMGFAEIDITGALGGRLDHTIANVMLLAMPETRPANVRILEENQEVILINKKTELYGEKGDTVSLLPLSQEVSGIRIKGLQYVPEDGVLQMSNPIGVSNVFSDTRVKIEIEQGLLLVIRVKDNEKADQGL